jgi:hypothetical protein
MYEAASTCYVDLAVISLNLDNVLEVPAGLTGYRETATIRTQILTCGAMLGRAGRRVVVHLSESWGGLKTRIPLLGDEEAECITGHVDQFSAHAGASFADFFANHHEAPLHAPTEQFQTELADAIVLVQRGPHIRRWEVIAPSSDGRIWAGIFVLLLAHGRGKYRFDWPLIS